MKQFSEWTGPPPGYGIEFYAGDADTIGDACRAAEWEGLRTGKFALDFVGFPNCVSNTGVLLLLLAEACKLQGLPEYTIDDYVRHVAEGEGRWQGLWAAELWHPQWVETIGSVPRESIPKLTRRFREAAFAEWDDDDPDWFAPEMSDAVEHFVALCRNAHENESDVIEVWVH